MTEPANSRKLTNREVAAAKPKPGRYVIWDTELPGFGLRVEPTGHKSFIARYRVGGGRGGILRQMTIGRYGILTPDQARRLARRTLGAAATGRDPVGDLRNRAVRQGLRLLRSVTGIASKPRLAVSWAVRADQ